MNEAIIDRVTEAAEKAAAAGVLRGVGEAYATYGPSLRWDMVGCIALGIVVGWLATRLIGWLARATFGG